VRCEKWRFIHKKAGSGGFSTVLNLFKPFYRACGKLATHWLSRLSRVFRVKALETFLLLTETFLLLTETFLLLTETFLLLNPQGE